LSPTPSAELAAAFHRGIYAAAFPRQLEPLESWLRGLRGEARYDFHLRVETEGDQIVAGIAYERYRASNVGLVTYLVVAPAARRGGIGRRLLADAVAHLGTPIVLGEVDRDARERIARFVRWGARIVGTPYIQPALGEGLARDRGLALISFTGGTVLDGATLRAFLEEFYRLTEGRDPDGELRGVIDAIPERVPLVEQETR